jgi:hypothetical protein
MATVVIESVRCDLTNPLNGILVPISKPKVDTNRGVWSHEISFDFDGDSAEVELAAGIYELILGLSKFVLVVPSGDDVYNWHDLLSDETSALVVDMTPLVQQKRFYEAATLTAMRAISYSRYNWECRLLDETMAGNYRWAVDATDADDGYNNIRPSVFDTYGAGVWQRWIG